MKDYLPTQAKIVTKLQDRLERKYYTVEFEKLAKRKQYKIMEFPTEVKIEKHKLEHELSSFREDSTPYLRYRKPSVATKNTS